METESGGGQGSRRRTEGGRKGGGEGEGMGEGRKRRCEGDRRRGAEWFALGLVVAGSSAFEAPCPPRAPWEAIVS